MLKHIKHMIRFCLWIIDKNIFPFMLFYGIISMDIWAYYAFKLLS